MKNLQERKNLIKPNTMRKKDLKFHSPIVVVVNVIVSAVVVALMSERF
jgi:hypothetical protein